MATFCVNQGQEQRSNNVFSCKCIYSINRWKKQLKFKLCKWRGYWATFCVTLSQRSRSKVKKAVIYDSVPSTAAYFSHIRTFPGLYNTLNMLVSDEVLIFIAYSLCYSLNMHAHLSSGVSGLTFSLSLYLGHLCMCESSKGPGLVWLCRVDSELKVWKTKLYLYHTLASIKQ